jgi:Ca2+:H+ antiporter
LDRTGVESSLLESWDGFAVGAAPRGSFGVKPARGRRGRKAWTAILLAGIPVAYWLRQRGGPSWGVFAASVLSLVPLALAIQVSTDHLASRLGAGLGGLVNATFGNAAELIITIFALRAGLIELVKGSLIGSILSNTLLGLGVSAIVGGLRHGTQKFQIDAVRRAAAMMILAVSAMALPAVFAQAERSMALQEEVSVGIAVLLLVTYVLYLVYSHFSRDAVSERRELAGSSPPPKNSWSLGRALGLLSFAVVATAIASDLLVSAVEPVSHSAGLSPFFVGLIVIPFIGNLPEYSSAITFAAQDRMDLSFAIAANSSIQIAVFVAPLLVLVSLLFHPLTLIFRPIGLVALLASSAIFAFVSLDGESDWFEGVQLVALYLICAVAFFFVKS